jgi:oligopeptide transport system substrate-binding protein
MTHVRQAAHWICVLTIVLTALGLPQRGHAAVGEQDQSVLRVHQQYFPLSLDPQQSSGVEFATVLGANYEGLTRLDEHLEVVPAAAESWEFNGDLSTIVFHLRPGLTYSDGTPLTAERFVDAIRRACDPHVHGDYQHLLFDIAGCQAFATLSQSGADGTPTADDLAAYEAAKDDVAVQALDDCTLEIGLTHAAPYFPAVAGMPILYPVKQELVAQGGEEWWSDPTLQVGNGPFQVTRIDPEQTILQANERYWDGRPQLDRLEFVYIPDGAQALAAYRAGDLDVVSLDAGLLPDVTQDVQLRQELVRLPMAATSFLSFNLTREPFTDKQVREAFAYAFDRDTYCQQVRGGVCAPALSWIPPDLPGAVDDDAYGFDPGRTTCRRSPWSIGTRTRRIWAQVNGLPSNTGTSSASRSRCSRWTGTRWSRR